MKKSQISAYFYLSLLPNPNGGLLYAPWNANATIFRCVDINSINTVSEDMGSNGSWVSSLNEEYMAVCSDTAGSTRGSMKANITRDGYYGSPGSYCWCRLVQPMVSQWVYTPVESGETCSNNCAAACARAVNDSSLRAKFNVSYS